MCLLRADNHPDAYVVRLEEDAQQIKVDQIRALIESLSLSSYRGGYKVAIIEGAEALNANGANAFLKTLEEPTGETLADPDREAEPPLAGDHREPLSADATCARRRSRRPRTWLDGARARRRELGRGARARGGAHRCWRLELQAAGIATLEEEMQDAIRQLSADAVDVTLLAERWVKSDPVLRLTWLENWITRRVRAVLAARTLRFKVRNRSACLPLYLSPR